MTRTASILLIALLAGCERSPAPAPAAALSTAPAQAFASPVPTPSPEPAPVTARTTRDHDCADFASHAEAQGFYEAHGGPDRDPHRLDRDRDGLACETLP